MKAKLPQSVIFTLVRRLEELKWQPSLDKFVNFWKKKIYMYPYLDLREINVNLFLQIRVT